MPSSDGFVTGLVLGAGGSRRLGRPKQLLPYGPASQTLLGHVVTTARACDFDQLVVALGVVDARAELLVLMLGDQPGVTPETVQALLAGRGDAPLAVCRYEDQRGHPFVFERRIFGELGNLHGDKGVWRLLDQRADDVVEVRIPGPVPLDVDTPEDYEAVLAAAGFTEAQA